MAEIKDGGPAYPTTGACYENMEPAGVGMTLRDKFAESALIGALASEKLHLRKTDDQLARDCYKMADAMLRAREVNHG